MQVETTVNSPAAVETPPLEAPAEEVVTSEVNEWATFAADADEDAGTIEGEFEVQGEVTNPEPVEVAPEVQPAVPEPVAPVVVEPEPIAPAPEPQAQPTQPVQSYADWRTQQEGDLTKFYAMDDETAQALISEPEVVLPKLAARVHLEVTESVLRTVQSMVPGMIQQVQSSNKQEAAAEDVFYTANPDLRAVDRAKILQIGAMFRQVNPNANSEQAVTVIGNMVRTALGLTAPAVAVAAPAPLAVQAQPYTPVRGGGSGAAPRVAVQANPWADLLSDDD